MLVCKLHGWRWLPAAGGVASSVVRLYAATTSKLWKNTAFHICLLSFLCFPMKTNEQAAGKNMPWWWKHLYLKHWWHLICWAEIFSIPVSVWGEDSPYLLISSSRERGRPSSLPSRTDYAEWNDCFLKKRSRSYRWMGNVKWDSGSLN